MALWIAAAFFGAYLANVIAGAAGAAFLSDVGEMILLWLASISFVVVILERERVAKLKKDQKK